MWAVLTGEPWNEFLVWVVSTSSHKWCSVYMILFALMAQRKWRQEQAEMLAQKDAEEEAALEELRAQARKELAEWYTRHDEQLTQTKASNR